MPKPSIQPRIANRGRWALKLGLLFFVLGLLRQDMVLIHLSLFLLFLLPFCDLLARMNLRRAGRGSVPAREANALHKFAY